MHGNTGLALFGLALVFIGIGMCLVACLGFVDQKIIDLPLGPAEGEIEQAARDGSSRPIEAGVLVLAGIVLVSLSAAGGDRDGRLAKMGDHRVGYRTSSVKSRGVDGRKGDRREELK